VPHACDLSVVMPVYNEAAAIEGVVRQWVGALDRLGIDYEVRIYNDGSRDDTAARLDGLAPRVARLRVVHHANRGHGPTILRGYAEATGAWVFQTDSDDEIPASAFADVWNQREHADIVLGVRSGRTSDGVRRLLSWGAARMVQLLFGARVSDVNVPFRLIRRDALQRMLPRIPPDTFAPNVILSGLTARDRLRVVEVPVPAQPRATGQTSLLGWKVIRAGARAARQTLTAARSERRRRRPA
jgi:glycosyltransferase involved in cell wall biosynthesis